MSKALELRKIIKTFHQGDTSLEILKGVDLAVNKGEIVAIVGSSGSGKSTLLQIAGLLDSKYQGDVILGTKKVNDLTEDEKANLRLRKIGFVYQYHHLLKDFTAAENVAMPGIIAGEDYSKALKKAGKLLDQFSLADRAHHYPGQLSGGQQQRVAIARAMYNNPEIIFADEPTGNLDFEAAEKVFELFIENARNLKVATLMVTHNEALAKRCDRILRLEFGELVG